MVKLCLCIIITGVGHYFLIYAPAVTKMQNHIFPSKRFISVFQFDFSFLEEQVSGNKSSISLKLHGQIIISITIFVR